MHRHDRSPAPRPGARAAGRGLCDGARRGVRPGRRARALLAALSASAALGAAACGPAGIIADDPFAAQIEDAKGTRPLPPGSRYEEAASRGPLARGLSTDYATPPPEPGTAEDRVPDIVERGRIIIGVEQSMNLLSYRDAATGDFSGFEVDLAREIARDIFGDPDAVDFRLIEPSGPVAALADGSVDAVLRATSVTPARLGRADFSAPYLTARTGMLSVRGSGIDEFGDLEGKRVCVTALSPLEELMRAESPQSTLLLSAAWGDCLVSLQQYQAEAIVSDDTILAGIAAQEPGAVINPVGAEDDQYAVAVQRGDVGLARQVNATLERIGRDGTWNRLFDKWFGGYLAPRPMPTPVYAEPEGDGAGDGAAADDAAGDSRDASGGAGERPSGAPGRGDEDEAGSAGQEEGAR
ncbi:transporter substrate-binding domain-containing protein [Corynebacterium sp. 335C]